jgi:hypothetical protein
MNFFQHELQAFYLGIWLYVMMGMEGISSMLNKSEKILKQTQERILNMRKGTVKFSSMDQSENNTLMAIQGHVDRTALLLTRK